MNHEEYRAAFDAVTFSEDFQARTIKRLTQDLQKETIVMKPKRTARTLLIAAVIVLAIAATAVAAKLLLSPKEVAAFAGDKLLATAFDSDDAVILDQTAESDGYILRLAGTVSGKNLSSFADVDASRTYIVTSMMHADGTPIEEANFDTIFTPLVAGFQPHMVNLWTLGGGGTSFLQDGVAYYLYDLESIEMFADHTIYLAVYQGGAPSTQLFTMAEDGSISFNGDIPGPHALFTLPMDESKADPAAVAQFLVDTGLAPRS